jgi:hypothetical protein
VSVKQKIKPSNNNSTLAQNELSSENNVYGAEKKEVRCRERENRRKKLTSCQTNNGGTSLYTEIKTVRGTHELESAG